MTRNYLFYFYLALRDSVSCRVRIATWLAARNHTLLTGHHKNCHVPDMTPLGEPSFRYGHSRGSATATTFFKTLFLFLFFCFVFWLSSPFSLAISLCHPTSKIEKKIYYFILEVWIMDIIFEVSNSHF